MIVWPVCRISQNLILEKVFLATFSCVGPWCGVSNNRTLNSHKSCIKREGPHRVCVRSKRRDTRETTVTTQPLTNATPPWPTQERNATQSEAPRHSSCCESSATLLHAILRHACSSWPLKSYIHFNLLLLFYCNCCCYYLTDPVHEWRRRYCSSCISTYCHHFTVL